MAITGGGFAGGLAEGIRNGVDLAKEYERTQTLKDYNDKQKRDAQVEQEIRDSIAQASKPTQGQDQGSPDLSSVQAAPSVDLGQSMGLAPVTSGQASPSPVSAPAALAPVPVPSGSSPAAGVDAAPMAAATGAGLGGTPALGGALPPATSQPVATPAAPGAASGAGLDTVTADYKLPQQPQAQPGQRYFSGSDVDRSLAGLTAGITTAWDKGRPDLALNMMVQREKIAATHRDQAYGQAMSQYQITGDPNAFVPFVNHYLPTGLHIDSVEPGPKTSNGTQIYTLKGRDITNGQTFSRAVSAPQLQQFIQGVGDPATQKAMFAQQAHVAYKDQQAILASRLKQEEEDNKPITVGKDQTAYKLGKDGTYTPVAFGSDASATGGGMTKGQIKDLVTQNKNLAGYVFKLNGVSDLSSVGTDQRKAIANTIALGENINRLNQGETQLGDANTAQLANDLAGGKASLYPVRLKGGSVGYATNYNGQQVLVPNSAVPMVIRQRFERGAAAPEQKSDQKPAQ